MDLRWGGSTSRLDLHQCMKRGSFFHLFCRDFFEHERRFLTQMSLSLAKPRKMSDFYPLADTPPATPPPLLHPGPLAVPRTSEACALARMDAACALLLVFGLVHASPFVHVRDPFGVRHRIKRAARRGRVHGQVTRLIFCQNTLGLASK